MVSEDETGVKWGLTYLLILTIKELVRVTR